ncbi:MAG: DUF5672 family protein [Opitutaceae bacterium]
MLELPSVTLACVDCINPAAALIALRRSSLQCRFARAVLVTDEAPSEPHDGIEVKRIPRLASREAYSRFMLTRLGDCFSTGHVLVAQWDGYVVNAGGWRAEFLEYDYIGAKWWHKDGRNVGNGGFSLRSRKLVDAVQALGLAECDHNEDDVICRAARPALEARNGIRFADEAIADGFAFERGVVRGDGLPFGFHGFFNMWRFLSPEDLPRLLDRLHPRTILYVETLELAQQYLRLKRHEEALAVTSRVLDHNPNSIPALKMFCFAAHHSGRRWLAAQALKELRRLEPPAKSPVPAGTPEARPAYA